MFYLLVLLCLLAMAVCAFLIRVISAGREIDTSLHELQAIVEEDVERMILGKEDAEEHLNRTRKARYSCEAVPWLEPIVWESVAQARGDEFQWARKLGHQVPLAFASIYLHQAEECFRASRPAHGVVMFRRALAYSQEAKRMREHPDPRIPEEALGDKEPDDWSIIGGCSFFAATIPLLGAMWKEKALFYLRKMEHELTHPRARTSSFSQAELYSKLYALTGKKRYRDAVKGSGISRQMITSARGHGRTEIEDRFRRIAKHSGFTKPGKYWPMKEGDLERFLDFLES